MEQLSKSCWIDECGLFGSFAHVEGGRQSTKSHEPTRSTGPELILKDEVYQIVGAALDVYHQLGREFLEPVYQEAMEIELSRRDIRFEAQKRLTVYYKGQALSKKYIADLVCFDQIIAELKVCECLTGREEAQILNYMKVTHSRVGLLLNFGSPVRLEWKRYVI